jgi:hypothetical protein
MADRSDGPTFGEMAEEIMNLVTGLGVMLLPALLLAIPALILLLPLALPLIPLALLALPVLLARAVWRRLGSGARESSERGGTETSARAIAPPDSAPRGSTRALNA